LGAEVAKKLEMPEVGDPLRKIIRRTAWDCTSRLAGPQQKVDHAELNRPKALRFSNGSSRNRTWVVENYRPASWMRLGLGWDTLSSINPRIVFLPPSSYGQTGVNKDRRAYGRIGEAFGGFAHLTGEADVHHAFDHGPWRHRSRCLGCDGRLMALYWRDAQGGGVGQVD